MLKAGALWRILFWWMKKMRERDAADKFFKLAFGLIAALVLSYAVLRAARLSLTFDEAATYISYLSSNFLAVFNLTSANNHLLSTLLARLGCSIAGSGELVLRWPSLFGLILYLLFSWAILKKFFGRTAALAGFLLLNLNPYVLDFFSLSRGYGLALGLEMTALYFFMIFLDSARGGRRDNERVLRAALVAAFASAMANLSFLDVLAGLWIVIFIFSLIAVRPSLKQGAPALPPEKDAARGHRWVVAAMALSIPFNLVLVGQHVRLSGKLIEPLSVSFPGLGREDAGRVIVCGDDIFGREVEFPGRSAVWTMPGIVPLKRIKLGLTAAAAINLQAVDIDIGPRKLRFGPAQIKKWRHLPREGLEYFLADLSEARRPSFFGDMSEVINWKGDGVFFQAYAGEAALILIIGALSFLLISVLGRIFIRWRLLWGPEWRALRDSIRLSALYFISPIVIMEKSGAFYYGGHADFVRDTVGSLISDSFYGIRYAALQEKASLTFILGTVILFLLLFAWGRLRKSHLADGLEKSALLAVMAIIMLQAIAERVVFDSPYIMGRTAIFLIPLYALFFLFFLRDLGRLGRGWRPTASVLLAAAVALAAYHGFRSANLTHTMDWRCDADTKTMLDDVASRRAGNLSGLPRIRLGVDWLFWPAAEYYRRKDRLTWLDISMLPTARHCDLYFLSPGIPRPGSRVIIKTYPRTGNVLAE